MGSKKINQIEQVEAKISKIFLNLVKVLTCITLLSITPQSYGSLAGDFMRKWVMQPFQSMTRGIQRRFGKESERAVDEILSAYLHSSRKPLTHGERFEEFGRNITKALKDGQATEVVGRDEDITEGIYALASGKGINITIDEGMRPEDIIKGLAAKIVSKSKSIAHEIQDIHFIEIDLFKLGQGSTKMGDNFGTLLNGRLERLETLMVENQDSAVYVLKGLDHLLQNVKNDQGASAEAQLLLRKLDELQAQHPQIKFVSMTKDSNRKAMGKYLPNILNRVNTFAAHIPNPSETLEILAPEIHHLLTRKGISIDDSNLVALVHMAEKFMEKKNPDATMELLRDIVARLEHQTLDGPIKRNQLQALSKRLEADLKSVEGKVGASYEKRARLFKEKKRLVDEQISKIDDDWRLIEPQLKVIKETNNRLNTYADYLQGIVRNVESGTGQIPKNEEIHRVLTQFLDEIRELANASQGYRISSELDEMWPMFQKYLLGADIDFRSPQTAQYLEELVKGIKAQNDFAIKRLFEGSEAGLNLRTEIDLDSIAESISKLAHVSKSSILKGKDAMALYREIGETLDALVIGQAPALKRVMIVVKNVLMGVTKSKGAAGFLMMQGDSRTGKSLITRLMGKKFGVFYQIPGGDIQDASGLTRLKGADPGYIGFGQTESFLDFVERHKGQYIVVNFDEYEKIHESIQRWLLDLYDDPMKRKSDGTLVDCSKVFFTFTSNSLAKRNFPKDLSLSEAKTELMALEAHLPQDKKKYPQEFLNRMDDIIILRQFDQESTYKLVKTVWMNGYFNKLLANQDVEVYLDDPAIRAIAKISVGDASVSQAQLNEHVAQKILDMFGTGEIQRGDIVEVKLRESSVAKEVVSPSEPPVHSPNESPQMDLFAEPHPSVAEGPWQRDLFDGTDFAPSQEKPQMKEQLDLLPPGVNAADVAKDVEPTQPLELEFIVYRSLDKYSEYATTSMNDITMYKELHPSLFGGDLLPVDASVQGHLAVDSAASNAPAKAPIPEGGN